MTEAMWKVLYCLLNAKLSDRTHFRAIWQLEDEIGLKLAGGGVPDGDTAIGQLLEMGLIEEVPNLGCRYQVVVKNS